MFKVNDKKGRTRRVFIVNFEQIRNNGVSRVYFLIKLQASGSNLSALLCEFLILGKKKKFL